MQNKMIEEHNMTVIESKMPERLPASTDKLVTKHTLEANNGKIIITIILIQLLFKY